jgi:DNA-binding response OmpR family regulator
MKQYKILVVEDELPLRTGLFDLFTSEGYAVVLAESGSAGLKAYGRERPDIIVLDIMMPEQSGYDVLSEIRRSDPVIPVLLLTARSEESDKVIGLELGADDYITKPFGIRELLSRVKAALRRVKVRKNLRLEPEGDATHIVFLRARKRGNRQVHPPRRCLGHPVRRNHEDARPAYRPPPQEDRRRPCKAEVSRYGAHCRL